MVYGEDSSRRPRRPLDVGGSDHSALEIDGISKSFFGTPVLREVSLDLRGGEIHALLGENGAGKSTLIKIMSGAYTADSGRISVPGDEHTVPRIAFVHQDLALVQDMTIAENLGHVMGFARHRGLISWRATARRATDALRRVGIALDPGTKISSLTRGEQTLVAIARAFAIDAQLMVLDEPTATLQARDVSRLFELLRDIRDKGIGILYVTHRLDEVFTISDRVTVLRDGQLISTSITAQTSLAKVTHDIVGRPLTVIFPPRPAAAATEGPSLCLDQLSVRDSETGRVVGPVSLQASAGEIVGIVGLRGAGQELIAQALRHRSRRHAGSALFRNGTDGEGEQLDISHVGVVPQDRKAEALLEGLTLRENVFADRFSWRSEAGRVARCFGSGHRERVASRRVLDRFRVVPNDPERVIETLSGGNQQKVILARAVTAQKKVLLLEEPTAGVDVGGRAEIYRLIRDAAHDGHVVVVVSTDFEEVAGLCDRVVIIRAGQVVGEVSGPDATVEGLANVAAGTER